MAAAADTGTTSLDHSSEQLTTSSPQHQGVAATVLGITGLVVIGAAIIITIVRTAFFQLTQLIV